jgi:hypothetical protein
MRNGDEAELALSEVGCRGRNEEVRSATETCGVFVYSFI